MLLILSECVYYFCTFLLVASDKPDKPKDYIMIGKGLSMKAHLVRSKFYERL